MRLERLDHFGIEVSDRERAERFYTGVLGLSVVARFGDQTLLDCGGQNLALFVVPRPPIDAAERNRRISNPLGKGHFAFNVNRFDFETAKEEFTAAGDPFRLDFGWQNGTRGFLHSVALGRDSGQAKVLAYTAAAVREKIPDAEFTAITEVPPQRGNARHEFTVSLLESSRIQVVPLAGLDQYARALGGRLN